MLMIRFQRIGRKKAPAYRLIVSEKHKDTQAGSLEILGQYNPTMNPKVIELKADRIQHWISVGAQPSDSVHNLLVSQGIISDDKKKRSISISQKRQGKLDQKRAAAEEKKREAAEKAAAEAEAAKAAEEEAKAKAAEEEAAKKAAEEAAAEAPEAPAAEEPKAEEAPAEEAPAEASSEEDTKEAS